MRRCTVSLLTLSCCLTVACQTSGPGRTDDGGTTTTLRLEANADGDLESCDSKGNCETLDNPDACSTLVVSINDSTGQNCERCESSDGSTTYDRCSDTRVLCTKLVIPEPDCVVCSYEQGSVVYSTCIPDDRTDCSPQECGPMPRCAAYECWDGSSAGCTGKCERDPATKECGYAIRECPPNPKACTPQECGPAPLCPAQQCQDGSFAGCTGICERDADTGECQYMIRHCPPNPGECTPDECGPARKCAVIECWDGSSGGCIDLCERNEATGTCGWLYRECPADPTTKCLPEDCGRAACPATVCPDGTSTTECACTATSDGQCQWTPINTCEVWCDATLVGSSVDCKGQCRWDSDCADGSRCEGSSVCPPDLECIWAGEPGWCVPNGPRPCAPEECGPPPPCGAPLQCEDGGVGGGCSCERNSDSGQCGWKSLGCPLSCGDTVCGDRLVCCNPLLSLCVPADSKIACIQ